MASNLSTIGFTFADDTGFEQTMVRLANEARERLATEAGEYAIWRSRTGAEIWFHLGNVQARDADSTERDIIGLTPFFEGESDVLLSITASMQRPEDNPFEGLQHAWVAPDSSGIGSYPIVFEAVDFAAHPADEAYPAGHRCRVVAFCRDLTIHDSVDAMLAADVESGDDAPQMAPKALIPIGLFADRQVEDAAPIADNDADMPQPTVLMRGVVREHRRLVNEITGGVFHWMLVETLEATFDMLADDELIDKPPHAGSAVEAYAWMFGRTLG